MSAIPVAVFVEREVAAPIADVYAAWTTPALMARWLSPTGRAEVEADVRVGGTFRVAMVGDGTRIEHTGEYLRLDPPHGLAFTWRSAYTGPDANVVTVTLTAREQHTLVQLSHERLPAATAESHRGGWGTILDRLQAVLAESDGR
ncbi:MAG TPA: SRPBCC domain-containing protein [Candidatus Dormibacteraeota bacterium]